MDNLEKLLYLAGVAADYLDYDGHHREFSRDQRLRVLQVMGYQVDDEQAVARHLFALDAQPWLHWLRPWYVVSEQCPALDFHCHPDVLDQPLQWELRTEAGVSYRGELRPDRWQESGNYVIDAVRYSARRLELDQVLPEALPCGYHTLLLRQGEHCEQSEVMVAPAACHDPLEHGSRVWGISCQLYSIRSPRNWGIGDFTDLGQLIELAAPLGADLVGINPLHALIPGAQASPSPYSPSDRRFINPLYIDPEAVPGFGTGQRVRELLQDPALERQRQALRDEDQVDYQGVSRLKYRVFEALYQDFVQSLESDPQAGATLREFVVDQGEALQSFGNYEAAANTYAPVCGADPAFHHYLQWLAAGQYQACQDRARASGMRVGLVGDLAVGSVREGCEVGSDPDQYVTGASVGAPPDAYSDTGQDWGLPAPDPLAMRRDHFRHFVELLRANMRHCGALRVDHIMALLRLWWCFCEQEGEECEGVYVYYPLRELLALLRLESRRNRCLVVGEDLGVVPDEIRWQMADSGIFGNTLFYFEQHYDGRFKAPWEQRVQALLMVTSHDVTPLAGWWNCADLHLRREVGVIASQEDLERQLQAREHDKQGLLRWLEEQGLLPPERQPDDTLAAMDYDLITAIHRACARSVSRLLLLQLEDLQLMEAPINIPATSRQYPNWRRKQARNLQDIFEGAEVRQLLQVVHRERNGE